METRDRRCTVAQELILIADDNPDTRLIFRTIFEARGFAVVLATNGEEAVDLATKHRPDLIFMDLMMPDIDGWEAIARLQATPEIASIPVVAMSASQPNREKARKAGFCAYLTKPITPTEAVRSARICLAAREDRPCWIPELERRVRVASGQVSSSQSAMPSYSASPRKRMDGAGRASS